MHRLRQCSHGIAAGRSRVGRVLVSFAIRTFGIFGSALYADRDDHRTDALDHANRHRADASNTGRS